MFHEVQDSQECRRGEFGQTVVQGCGSIFVVDGSGFLEKDVASVESFIHLDDGDAGLSVAVEDGGGDAGSAAMAG